MRSFTQFETMAGSERSCGHFTWPCSPLRSNLTGLRKE